MTKKRRELGTLHFMFEFTLVCAFFYGIIFGIGSGMAREYLLEPLKNNLFIYYILFVVISLILNILAIYVSYRYLSNRYIIKRIYKIPIIIYIVVFILLNIYIDINQTLPNLRNDIAMLATLSQVIGKYTSNDITKYTNDLMQSVANLFILIRFIVYSINVFFIMFLFEKYSEEELE